jgi:holliday junction DNA helicase RuvA
VIAKLKGILEEIIDDQLVVDVDGVGYLVHPIPSKINPSLVGEKIVLYIHTHVKEEEITLFGFEKIEEKEAFLTLNQVNGVGPRVALNILSKIKLNDIQNAILTKNILVFKQVSGIGNKLAERIILELQNKILCRNYSSNSNSNQSSKVDDKKRQIFDDATSALMSLGMNYTESVNLVNLVIANHDNLEDVISSALKLRK